MASRDLCVKVPILSMAHKAKATLPCLPVYSREASARAEASVGNPPPTARPPPNGLRGLPDSWDRISLVCSPSTRMALMTLITPEVVISLVGGGPAISFFLKPSWLPTTEPELRTTAVEHLGPDYSGKLLHLVFFGDPGKNLCLI